MYFSQGNFTNNIVRIQRQEGSLGAAHSAVCGCNYFRSVDVIILVVLAINSFQ